MLASIKATLTPVSDCDTSDCVITTIQKCSQIATLPTVAAEIIRLSEDPDSTFEQLNRVIVNDPVLGARILKLVNSAYYGMPGQIHTIQRAIVMLGFKAVKNIAIAASLVNMVRGGRVTKNFSATDLWNHSLAVATGTQMLAHRSEQVALDEAFLTGLIHDLGIVVEMQAFGLQFTKMIENITADESLTFRAEEEKEFGASHEAFGAGLCRNWNFPRRMELVTGFHHRPWDVVASERTLPALVHVADVLVARIQFGFTRTVETFYIDPILLNEICLTEADLNAVADQLPEAVRIAQGQFAD